MDLSNVKTKTVDVITLCLPNGIPLENDDKTPMTITVSGVYSTRYKSIVEEQQNERIKRAQQSGGKFILSSAEIAENRMTLVAKCIETWDITLNGQHPPKLDVDEAIKLFKRLPFVFDQVNAGIEDAQAFLEV